MTRMDRDGLDLGFYAALMALGIVLGAFLGVGDAEAFQPPACPEDSVIVGVGAFEHGRWSAYTCGPAFDDYQQEDR